MRRKFPGKKGIPACVHRSKILWLPRKLLHRNICRNGDRLLVWFHAYYTFNSLHAELSKISKQIIKRRWRLYEFYVFNSRPKLKKAMQYDYVFPTFFYLQILHPHLYPKFSRSLHLQRFLCRNNGYKVV